MSNPEIVYDGTTLAFPGGLQFFDPRQGSDRIVPFSHGGVAAPVLLNYFDRVHVRLERFQDAAFEAALHAWWSWAQRGKQYAFAFDAADKVSTTLDGTAAAGQPVVPLTSTTGIVVGTRYLIREAAGDEYEVGKVQSISAGVSVTLDANLKYGFAAGDIFRSRWYWPKLVALDEELMLTTHETSWTWEHRAREDRG